MMRTPRLRFKVLPMSIALLAAGCSGSSDSPAPEPEPVARVHVALARADTLRETLAAYGTVIPAPGSVQSFAVAFECVVEQLPVNVGQRVEQGTPLVMVTPSPGVQLAAEQARAELTTQQKITDDTHERFEMGLATHDETVQQEQVLANAQAQVQKFERWVAQKRLIAPASGLVREVLANEGALVPAGSPLVSLALQHRFEVRLGVEPEDVPLLRVAQPVRLMPVERGSLTPVLGRIRSVGQQVSLDTRLVDVLVAPPDGTDGLLLNQFVRAEIVVRGTEGIIVPRSALLPREDRFVLFTVRNGRAIRHAVDLGVQTDSLAQVHGRGLAEGDSVVILGNYELGDSMRVRVIGAAEPRTP